MTHITHDLLDLFVTQTGCQNNFLYGLSRHQVFQPFSLVVYNHGNFLNTFSLIQEWFYFPLSSITRDGSLNNNVIDKYRDYFCHRVRIFSRYFIFTNGRNGFDGRR